MLLFHCVKLVNHQLTFKNGAKPNTHYFFLKHTKSAYADTKK